MDSEVAAITLRRRMLPSSRFSVSAGGHKEKPRR